MSTRRRFWSSSIGTKFLIAVSGLALVGFLVLHLVGNLLVVAGPATFNSYAHRLAANPLLVPAELALLALFGLHVYKTLTTWRANRRARPIRYRLKRWAGHTSRKSIASSTMIGTGLVTLGFVVLHLKTFKYGPVYPAAEDPHVRDLYRLVVEVFHRPAYVGLYVGCMTLLGLHLYHGVASAFQSLGVDHPAYTRLILRAGMGLALLVGVGFALIPLYVYAFL